MKNEEEIFDYSELCGVYSPGQLMGQKLPDMELEAYHEDKIKKIKLSDYNNKWLILFFYPADFTFVCPTELKDMAWYYEQFKGEGAEVLSVSTDSVYAHKAWHDQSEAIKQVNFPMVADPSQQLTRSLGVLIEKEGVAYRSTFIIDPDGVIQSIEVNNNNIGRSAAETLRKLQALSFVKKHGGEVCPANWHPGDDTLKPDLDLVGKI